MSQLVIELIIILGLVVVNGGFALAEIAIVSLRKARLEQMVESGNQNAKIALEFATSPGDFLSTVQVGITLIGVLAGAFGGATIAEELAKRIEGIPALAPYAETIGVAIVVLLITYLSLIIGELVPKRIALSAPERISAFVARPMRVFSRAALPIVRILSASTEAVLWLLRIRRVSETPVTEDEVRILIRQGASAGVFEEAELHMVNNVFRLGSRRVNAIMTPRTDVVALYTTDSSDLILHKLREGGHSVFPLCDGSLDNVIGTIHVKDLLMHLLAGWTLDLRAVAKEAPSIPENSSALKTLDLLRQKDRQMAFVISEFGGLQGIVTVDDFADEVVSASSNLGTPGFVRRPDGSLLVDGILPLDVLVGELRLPELSDSSPRSFSTIGGFVLEHLGHIPTSGERFVVSHHQVEVLDMDGLRVDKVLITPTRAVTT